MKNPDMDAVVFDLGNVLIPWNPRFLYRKLFQREDEMERFLADICTPAWNETFDSEREFAQGVAELASRHPEKTELIRAYSERWEEMLGDEIGENVGLLKEAKEGGARVFALSNWPAEKWPVAIRRYAFLSLFEDIVVSGHVRTRKPSPEIFRILLSRNRLIPERAVFIDDTPGHVKAAQALGFKGIRYESPAQLRAELERWGLP